MILIPLHLPIFSTIRVLEFRLPPTGQAWSPIDTLSSPPTIIHGSPLNLLLAMTCCFFWLKVKKNIGPVDFQEGEVVKRKKATVSSERNNT